MYGIARRDSALGLRYLKTEDRPHFRVHLLIENISSRVASRRVQSTRQYLYSSGIECIPRRAFLFISFLGNAAVYAALCSGAVASLSVQVQVQIQIQTANTSIRSNLHAYVCVDLSPESYFPALNPVLRRECHSQFTLLTTHYSLSVRAAASRIRVYTAMSASASAMHSTAQRYVHTCRDCVAQVLLPDGHSAESGRPAARLPVLAAHLQGLPRRRFDRCSFGVGSWSCVRVGRRRLRSTVGELELLLHRRRRRLRRRLQRLVVVAIAAESVAAAGHFLSGR